MYQKLCNHFFKLLIVITPTPLWATLPTAASVADGASTTSPMQMWRDLGETTTSMIATAVAALIVLGIAWHIYGAFAEAREKREWKTFGITAGVGVVVAAGTVVMAILAAEYGIQV